MRYAKEDSLVALLVVFEHAMVSPADLVLAEKEGSVVGRDVRVDREHDKTTRLIARADPRQDDSAVLATIAAGSAAGILDPRPAWLMVWAALAQGPRGGREVFALRVELEEIQKQSRLIAFRDLFGVKSVFLKLRVARSRCAATGVRVLSPSSGLSCRRRMRAAAIRIADFADVCEALA